ncbi:hypothetical protein C0Q70_18421 [Pomacea canaliculata]|uniref:Reverse transcriptase domain-containing protein n=1 Tax=Pomacea canaliculata TaxID=400727 RepID=A0A2T7NN71_POMCA|nr:hypothetical protein C0Q70_18421 [Pomacea canaliculata]
MGVVDVHVANVTTKTVVLPSRTVIGELLPVTRVQCGSAVCMTEAAPSCVDSVTISPHLTVEQQSRIRDLISGRPESFSTGETDFGHVTQVKHEIQLTNDTPFKERHRRIPPGMYEQVREHLQLLLDSGIIRPSHSPWSSNVVWVKKKDGSLRQCVDYRQLNARTMKDSYALPRIEELLDALAGSKYFTVLDLKSGYRDNRGAQRTYSLLSCAPWIL